MNCFLKLALSLLIGVLVDSASAGELSWSRGEETVALKKGEATVWALKISKGDCKPCVHPLSTVGGFVLSDYRPADHLWHTALWFCFKTINGENYWEEDPDTLLSRGRTEVLDYKIDTKEDFSAEIRISLSYHLPGQEALLSEERLLSVSRPQEDGSYTLDWTLDFTAMEKVELERTPRIGEPGGVGHGGYAGMSARMSKQTVNWKFTDSENRADSHGEKARWMSFSGPTPDGSSAAMTIFDHPSNPRHPNRWFVAPGMPYFSPAFLFEKGMTLEKGEQLKLRYRIKVQDGIPLREDIEKEFESYGGELPSAASESGSGRRIDLVALGKSITMNYACTECHSSAIGGEPGKLGPGWYGLIGKIPHEHEVIDRDKGSGEMSRVLVDESYIQDAILDPTQHLPLRNIEPQKGEPFLPLMPPYPMLGAQEIAAIVAYLKTLNDAPQQGPAQVWVKRQAADGDGDEPFEVIVGDTPLVVRAAMPGVSTRAISVGLPGGYNYIFDPASFSVKRAWGGGFINLKNERTGRGIGLNTVSRIGHRDLSFEECVLPLGRYGQVDLSYKDYLNDSAWQLQRFREDLASPIPFLEQRPNGDYQFLGYLRKGNDAPIFLFRIDGVEYRQQLMFENDETLRFHFTTQGAMDAIRFRVLEDRVRALESSAGKLEDGILTIPAGEAAQFVLTLHLKQVPAPALDLARLALASSPGQADHAAKGPMAAIDGNEETYNPEIIPQGYSVKTIETPRDAQGGELQFGIGGIAFADDGTAVVASRVAGIWNYRDGVWTRFADGLHDPQGIYLAEKDGSAVVVAQKPELTLIKDIDHDGIADLYQTLCDQWRYAGNYCEYVHGPVVDTRGNYYVNLNLADAAGDPAAEKGGGAAMGTTLGYDGWTIKITPGGEFIPFASGLRSPAGIGIRSDDALFYTDNQGGWVGSSTFHQLHEGAFYGYPCSLLDLPEYRAGKKLDIETFGPQRRQPVLWLPHGELMNSPGDPIFDETAGKFGPFSGQVFIGCQARSNIVRANLEKIGGEYQGAVFNFVDHLQSGCIRIAFDPQGRLWVGQTGRGWASKGGKMFGLQRIAWDGKTTPFEMHSINLTQTGFKINFTHPVEKSTICKEAIAVSSWHYHYHGSYGSPKVDLKLLPCEIDTIADDGRSVSITVPLERHKVYGIELKGVAGAGGALMRNVSAYYTLNNTLP